MNIPVLAAEIARLIPELARDSQVNNAEFLERLIRSHANTVTCITEPLSLDTAMMLAQSIYQNGLHPVHCHLRQCGAIAIPGANGDPVEAFPL